jgi:HSP20 family protein
MCVAKTPLAGKAFHSKKLIHGFRFAKPLGGWKAKSSSTGLLHQMPGFIRERQPLIDVFEEEDHVLVLAELPGVDKKDVHIKADENTITITAENPTTKYLKMIRLPTRIKRGKAQVTYRNNILQVKLKKIY